MAQLDNLQHDLASLRSVRSGVDALISDLVKRLRDSAGSKSAVQDLADELQSRKTALVNAVTRNTNSAQEEAATDPSFNPSNPNHPQSPQT